MGVETFDETKKTCEISVELNNKSLIKIKARENRGIGSIHPCMSKPLTDKCYAEWRIGYNGINSELTPILTTFSSYGIFSDSLIKELIDSISNNINFLENKLTYQAKPAEDKLVNLGLKYDIVDNVHSSLFLEKESYEGVYIELCQLKQGKVNGYQPFLQICIPINKLKATPSLLGRKAASQEKATYTLGKDNCSLIIDTVKTFGAINLSYKNDMLSILGAIVPNL